MEADIKTIVTLASQLVTITVIVTGMWFTVKHIKETLAGHVEWMKEIEKRYGKLDEKIDEHSERLARMEILCQTQHKHEAVTES